MLYPLLHWLIDIVVYFVVYGPRGGSGFTGLGIGGSHYGSPPGAGVYARKSSGKGFWGETSATHKRMPQSLSPELMMAVKKEKAAKTRAVYSIAAFLADISRSDGIIDPKEKSVIIRICQNIGMSISSQSIAFRDVVWTPMIEEGMADEEIPTFLYDMARRNRQFRIALLSYAWQVAAADGVVTKDEIERIADLGVNLGGNIFEVEEVSTPYYRSEHGVRQDKQSLSVLGLVPGCSKEEIRKAFHRESLKYHPDRHPNVNDRQKEELARHFTEITVAYRNLTNPDQTMALYALHPSREILFTPPGSDEVCCLLCGENTRLGEKPSHTSARCPACKALLLYEKETAERLINYVPPSIVRVPTYGSN